MTTDSEYPESEYGFYASLKTTVRFAFRRRLPIFTFVYPDVEFTFRRRPAAFRFEFQ